MVGNFQVIDVSNQISIGWAPVNHADFWRYDVYRSSESPSSLELVTQYYTSTSALYLDGNLEGGVTYYYQVVTVDRGLPDYLGVALSSASAVISAFTTITAPLPPVIDTEQSVALSTSSILWVWNHATPPSNNGFRVFMGTTNISGNLAPTTTFYVQTSLLPNHMAAVVVQAFNAGGNANSEAVTRYTWVLPPTGSEITSVSTTSISLAWMAAAHETLSTYEVEYSINNSFVSSTVEMAYVSSMTLHNLTPNRPYYMRVRSLNGNNVPSAWDITITTRTLGTADTVAPAPVSGVTAQVLSVSGNNVTLMLLWDPVTANMDGTPITDLDGYMVRVHNSYVMAEEFWSETVITSTYSILTLTVTPAQYVAVRAMDTAGNQSPNSSILRASDLKFIVLADDMESRLEYTLGMANRLRANYEGNNGRPCYLMGHEMISHYAGGSVIKAVNFNMYYHGQSGPIRAIKFDEAETQVILTYTVEQGNIVQGSPTALSLANQVNSLGVSASNLPASHNIGNPIMSHQNVSGRLSMFWNNGVQWIKAGGQHDANAQSLSLTTSRMGVYQIRSAVQLGDMTLVQVYPRIFTPNGDGHNDVVFFEFGEGDLTGKTLSGEIFDITGMKVATLKPGPNPSRTLKWDGKTDNGQSVPGGIYIYQIEAGGDRANGTVVVAK
jgi:hypothetical protein